MPAEYATLPEPSPQDIERFWSKVQKTDGCWLWIGTHRHDKYGQFWIQRRAVVAHRLALFIETGVQPGNLETCHHCDNPPCVRPDHLFLGTALDNSRDCVQKGRQAKGPAGPDAIRKRGSENSQARLTDDLVRQIATDYGAGEHTFTSLGKKYGVSNVTIGLIVTGKAWKQVDRVVYQPPEGHFSETHPECLERGVERYNAKLTEEDVLWAREIHASGQMGLGKIARFLRLSKSTVYAIIKRKRWKHI